MSVVFTKRFIYAQAIFWGCFLIVGGIVLAVQIYKQYERAPYQKSIGSYLEKPQNNLLERYQAPEESIAIIGKLVVVNLNDKTIDPVFNNLPSELKPENPNQVRTVLWIECNPTASSLKYEDGSSALNNVCALTFVDYHDKKYLWTDTLYISPPAAKSRDAKPTVTDPGDSILSYLKGVPHKASEVFRVSN